MRTLKQEIYFPIIIGIHFLFWAIDLYFYQGNFKEVHSDTLLFGELKDMPWSNVHRILGEVFSSWVVTVFAFNFLMATRAKWVEKLFGGLDKMYLIHRRSAIIAVFLLIAHFVVVPRDIEFSIGKPLGFYALVLILLGVLISALPPLKKIIPYHKWINIHKLMGLFYVLAVVHGFTVRSLIQELPITRIYVFGMSIIGVIAWVYRAFLYNLFNKKLNYSIQSVKDLGNSTAEIVLNSSGTKLNYEAGQFAFFTFPAISKREQHPFTLSSNPSDDNLRITVKGLGDYTNNIAGKLEVGNDAIVEGPFGLFTQNQIEQKSQIWIAGGIGITPFLSLSKSIINKKVNLFWCVNEETEAVYAQELLETAKNNPEFDFQIWASKEKGYISVENLGVTDFSETDFLICGPAPLKKSIFQQLKRKNVKSAQIHDEEFAFR